MKNPRPHRSRLFSAIPMLAAALILAACSGSFTFDSDGDPEPNTPTPAIDLQQVVSGLASPLDLQSARDGSGRMFVVEQGGTIRILQGGAIAAQPFLDLRGTVTSGGESGLLGLAFHPAYSTNRKFYVNYTRNIGGQLQTVIAEFLASAADPNQADAASQRVLLTVNQPFSNHNGGQLAFGADAFLYIALGDGGSGGDPLNHAQNRQTLLGKILRINVDTTGAGRQYAIPADNPFADGVNGQPEIWAYGLRNPWRMSFDRVTGRLFAADVGQSSREEINLITRGGNFGWNVMEGTQCFNPSTNCNTTGLVLPIADYGRTEGSSVTGGYVYRGSGIPNLVGTYVFGDFVSGRIFTLRLNGSTWTREQALSTARNFSAFGEDQNGDLYVLDYNGVVLRVVAR